jgi:hypothetical protein
MAELSLSRRLLQKKVFKIIKTYAKNALVNKILKGRRKINYFYAAGNFAAETKMVK